MKKLLLQLKSMLLLPMLFLLLMAMSMTGMAQNIATVMTDKNDYMPGQVVTISGTNWEPGETVIFKIEHLVYSWHEAETIATAAKPNGDILDDSYIINPLDLGETFLLTATGQTSSKTASWQFTDGDKHDIFFQTTGLTDNTSVTVNWSGTSDNGSPFSGSTTFNSPGPTGSSQKVTTQALTSFSFSFPTITGYIISSTSKTSPFTTGAKNGSTTVLATYAGCTPPSITTQPVAQPITYGANASFSVVASGTAPLTYQWQVSTNSGGSWSDIGGATSATLTLVTPTVAMSGYQYHCMVTGACSPAATSNAGTLTVAKKALIVSATGVNKPYDATPVATVTLSDNRISGDVLTTAYTAAAFNNKNVGTAKPVSVSGISISGTDAGNYTANATATTAADITARNLHLSNFVAGNKTYDGNTDVLTGAGFDDNRVAGDALTFSYNKAFVDKNVGTGKAVNFTSIAISGGADELNYSLATLTGTAHADITKKPIIGNFTVDDTKVYDGGTLSNVLTRTLNDVIGLDNVSLTSGTANYNTKHIGTGKVVSLTGMSLTGPAAGNYSLTSVATTTANITQRPINVTAQTDSRLYNGTTSSAVSPVVDPLQPGDVIGTAPIQVYDTRNVGTNKTMTASSLVINDGNSSNNYSINYVANLTGVIIVRPFTVNAVTNMKVYDGNTSALAVPTYPAFQAGDILGTAPIEVYDTPLAGTGKTMTASGLVINDGNGSNNYLISYVTNTTGVITQASTTLTLTLSGSQVHFMDNVTFTAVVKPLNTATPLTGSVNFVIGAVTYNAVVVPIPDATDGSVQAMVIKQLPSTIIPGSYTVTAKFTSSNANYSDSNTDSKTLKVDPRDATPYNAAGFYVGDGFAWTTGPSSSTGTLTLVAAIRDANNPAGDVRGAKVSFYVVNGSTLTAIPSAQNLPVGLVDVTDGSLGTASAIVQLNIGSNNAQSFQIAVKVTGAYQNNPWDALSESIVTVSKPVAGGYITGGSSMTNSNSSGYIKGATGMNTGFEFDIQYTKSGTNPKGKVNVLVSSYYDRNGILDSKLHLYSITTNAIALLAISSPTATGTFSAKANMVEQLPNGTTVSVESGATFQMVAFQNACDQEIAITYYRKAGGVWFSSNWDALKATSVLQGVNSGSQVYVAGGGNCTGVTSNTLLTSTKNPSNAGELVTFKATVTGIGTPTGTIIFKDGANVLTTIPIPMVGGSASYSISTLTAVSHTITAVYSGDVLNKGSQGLLTQIVNPTKAAYITTEVTPNAIVKVEPTLKAYPNPFTERLNIEFSSATDTQATLEIYSITGAKLATLFNGPVAGGVMYKVEYVPNLVSSQMVLYKLTMNGKTHVGKILYNEKR